VAQGQAEGQEACGQLDDSSNQQLGSKDLIYGKRKIFTGNNFGVFVS
jgi:hypothetical protein